MLLLMPLAWLALLLLFREAALRQGDRQDWRITFILASAAWGALLSFGTEVLSLFTSLNVPCVRLFWLFLNAVLWGALLWLRRGAGRSKTSYGFIEELRKIRAWPVDALVMLGVAVLFAAFLGVVAIATPTTNWDSLTYHLPRVIHWIQQHSVAHYPSNMEAQLQLGPWSGYVQAHLWLLWGNDRFENMLQWSAMAGSILVATLLAGQLQQESPTTDARMQAFAAILVVTLPTGIVESITTQTDYTTGFWFLCLASLGLAWWKEPINRFYALGFGIVLGLGILTKFTAIIYAAPVGTVVAAALLWKARRQMKQVVLPATAALTICLALMLPHFIRNKAVFGSTIGSKATMQGTGIARITLSGTLSNMIRNLELHSNTGIPALTHQLNNAANAIQSWTRRAPNDLELSNRSSMYVPPDEFFVFDSFAASSWHVMLIAVAFVAACFNFKKNRLALAGFGLALAGFALFCMALQWQLWNTRYHLPLLLLCLPSTASILVPQFGRWFAPVIATGLVIFGVAIVSNNRSRPIFDASWRAQSREEQLLSFQGVQYYGAMKEVAAKIVALGCVDVGLKLGPDHPEYPFWVMLRKAGFKGEIHHQLVTGASANLMGPPRWPDVIITTMSGRPGGSMAELYPTESEIGPYTLHWAARVKDPMRPSKTP